MSAAALLVLNGIACIRGGRLLFAGLDLRLGPGEAALVAGPNGVGKSSLIRIAAGLLRPAAGRVTAARMALSDERMALDERRPLGPALQFWTALDGGGTRETAAAMAAFGITHLAAIPVHMLSTGQRKRASLARILASGAPLWLLDEPANGLDGDGLSALDQAVAAHRAAGGAVLVASHQPIELHGAREVRLA